MVLATEEISALTILSAFIAASLSLIIVIYQLEWNYFNNKGSGMKRTRRVELKDRAAERTMLIFVLQRNYFFLAYVALALSVFTYFVPSQFQIIFAYDITILVWFFALMLIEIETSIKHISTRRYRTE